MWSTQAFLMRANQHASAHLDLEGRQSVLRVYAQGVRSPPQ